MRSPDLEQANDSRYQDCFHLVHWWGVGVTKNNSGIPSAGRLDVLYGLRPQETS